MRFLVNENVPASVIRGLRERGHDVLSVKESMRSANDKAILTRAEAEQRILVTHDKDFGELGFRRGLPSPCGIILFRLSGRKAEADRSRILEVLSSDLEFTGCFSVVTDDRVRVRPLRA
jgi:predicted nuclease of predicted toxin-antitoxin system